MAALVGIFAVSAAYKLGFLGYSLADIMPRTRYDVALEMRFDGHDDDASVTTFLPMSDSHQTISDEESSSPGLHLTTHSRGGNRIANWSGVNIPAGARIRHSFAVLARAVHFQLDPKLEVPGSYPASVVPYLKPEKDIQVDAAEIRQRLTEIGADQGSLVARLDAIFRATSAMPQRPFKGVTDALTALRLGEASCNGKSRLFVALSRATGIPARLVGGLIMQSGVRRVSHQWAEAYVGGHWVPFDATNKHFATLPEHYLTLYYGDEVLYRHTKDINFDYRYVVETMLVPSPKAKASFHVFNIWAAFERLGLSFTLLRTLLMLPIGALVVVLLRNVVGTPTYGTFLPALIAAAASETGALWGTLGLIVVVVVVAFGRMLLVRLELLHSPTLAILLAGVAVSLITITMIADQLGLHRLTRISLFPIAVVAITSERFYLSLAEQGVATALKHLGGTFAVVFACYIVMSSPALQVLVIGFPEVLLVVVALNIYLGRWVGVRLSEYRRFRQLLLARAKT
ncbi:MAG: transglutaminase [Deltaproteobacteria bacterium]|nr:transglutaminase [Deltaproteobacteria bacterium]